MFTRHDMLLIAIFVIAALLGIGVMRYRVSRVDSVVVRVDGEEVIRKSIGEDARFSVEGAIGKTEVEINDSRVRVIDSPCARKTCVHTGWIQKAYQIIICVPNRVEIRLTGGIDDSGIDGITE